MSAEENKAIEDMDHEEVIAALPKLREEAAKAEARVQAAMERVAQTAEVPTYVEVHNVCSICGSASASCTCSRGMRRRLQSVSALSVPLISTTR